MTDHDAKGMGELVIYRTEDGRDQIQLRLEDGSVWLTQAEIAGLFDTTKQNVSLHLKTIFADEELSEGAVVKESLTTAADGKRYKTKLYNLKAILAVGYRVRSPRGTQFRRWATTALEEYLIKGFVMNDERLKEPGGLDYFDELLERIRDIRASEKRLLFLVANEKAFHVDIIWRANDRHATAMAREPLDYGSAQIAIRRTHASRLHIPVCAHGTAMRLACADGVMSTFDRCPLCHHDSRLL